MAVITTKKRRFDVMGAVLSPILAMVMEILWIYPWLVWSGEYPTFTWTEPPLTLLSLLAVIIMPYLITQYIPAKDRFMPYIKILLVVITVAIVINLEYGGGFIPFSKEWLTYISDLLIESFTTLHPIGPAVLVSAYLSWRGIKLSTSTTFSEDLYRSFLIGLVATIILIFTWAATLGDEKSLAAIAGIYIAGFFFFGLSAMAMGNYLKIRDRLLREKSAPLSNRRWLFILSSLVGGMVVIGLLVSALFSPEYFDSVRGFFGKAFEYLTYPLQYIAYALTWLVQLIEAIMAWLISLVRAEPREWEPPQFGVGETPEFTPGDGFNFMIIFKWAFIILSIALVIYLLHRAGKRMNSRRIDSDVEEFSESVWSWLGFKEDFIQFFSRLFDRWFGSRLKNIGKRLSYTGHKDTVFADDMDIREIYRNMLNEASESGHSRHSYETPYEYAGRLNTAVPDINDHVNDITDLYVNVRYGENRLKEWETEHANVLWRLIHRVFHRGDKETPTHP